MLNALDMGRLPVMGTSCSNCHAPAKVACNLSATQALRDTLIWRVWGEPHLHEGSGPCPPLTSIYHVSSGRDYDCARRPSTTGILAIVCPKGERSARSLTSSAREATRTRKNHLAGTSLVPHETSFEDNWIPSIACVRSMRDGRGLLGEEPPWLDCPAATSFQRLC